MCVFLRRSNPTGVESGFKDVEVSVIVPSDVLKPGEMGWLLCVLEACSWT